MFCEDEETDRIGYADVTSLYPWVNALCEYPVGHPTRTRDKSEFRKLNDLFGFQYCKVRSPTNLRIPILPLKRDGKLMFAG